MPVAAENAGDQIQRRADDNALVGVEHQYLPEMRDDQQLIRRENPWRGGHSDHRLTPPDPLRRREGQHRARLADVEIVEPVEQRTGQAAALHQPGAPALAGLVVGLPHHERAAARRLRVDGKVAARPERHLGGQVAFDRTPPFQPQRIGPRDGRVAAVARVAVLRGPAVCGVRLDPGIGGSAAGQDTGDQRC
jgi:hypothetical protein